MIFKIKFTTRKNKQKIEHNAILALFASFFVIYPPLINWISFGTEGIVNYLANDAFYYLTIAKNYSWKPLFSFDGEYPTNGFHLLHQLFLKLIFNTIFFRDNYETQLIFLYFSSIFFISLSLFLIFLRIFEMGFVKSISIIALVPGFFFIMFSSINNHYGAIWSYINGMESSFSILFFSIIFFITLKKNFIEKLSIKKILLISFLATFIFFSRLDDIFFLISIALSIFIYRNKITKNYLFTFLFLFIPAILILVYLFINFNYAQSFLPSSGASKFGLSAYYNLMSFFNIFLPAGEIFSINNWSVWQKTSWRSLHIFLPFLISIYYVFFYLAANKKIIHKNLSKFLFVLSAYVILKSLYNLFFVWLWHQGHWYYPINILAFNLIILFFIQEFIEKKKIKKLSLLIQTNKKFKITKSLIVINATILLFLAIYFFKAFLKDPFFFEKLSILRLFSYICIFLLLVFLTNFLFKIINEKKEINIFSFNIFLIFLIFLYSNSYVNIVNKSNSNKKNFVFFDNYKKINSDLYLLENNFKKKIKILSFDDGIISYFLNFNVMSGFGFALDKEALNEKNKGRLLDLAEKRGYNYISSINYLYDFEYKLGANINSHIQNYFWLSEYEKNNYNFSVVYEEINSKFKLIYFEKIR